MHFGVKRGCNSLLRLWLCCFGLDEVRIGSLQVTLAFGFLAFRNLMGAVKMEPAQASVQAVCTRCACAQAAANASQMLQQHHDLLEAHKRFLANLKKHSKDIAGVDDVLNICTTQTESMVEDLAQCKSKFVSPIFLGRARAMRLTRTAG
jgi:hypothetical protein